MNILFLTLLDFKSIDEKNIYTDLLREFYKNGHSVYAISPVERRKKQKTKLIQTDKATILKLKIGNTQKTNIIEKGISTVSIESQFIYGIKNFFSDVRFELVIYSTPPITFCNAIEFVRKRDRATTYLLLKDIFPQNAVDIGIMTKQGLRGIIYRITFCNAIEFVRKRDRATTYLLLKDIFPQNAVDIGIMTKQGLRGIIYRIFRAKEKKLYRISDHIGCMSQANVNYILEHNPEIDPNIVEVCPNSVEVIDMSVEEEIRKDIRSKYEIPLDKKVFVYGGNLGRPQGINFMIKCLKSQEKNKDVFFLIVGDGTEFDKIEAYVHRDKPSNVRLMKRLPKEDYDKMVGACDVGMIFLDHRFTIPNFPSRLLSYMQAKIPVLAVTDPNTDIGKVIVDGGFGWWCESNSLKGVNKQLQYILKADLSTFKRKEYCCLKEHYSTDISYRIIMRAINH